MAADDIDRPQDVLGRGVEQELLETGVHAIDRSVTRI